MKAFLSIYIDLENIEIDDEALHHFTTWLDKQKNILYEGTRNQLGLTPSDFGRKCKAEHGIKDGREKVEPPKTVKKTKKAVDSVPVVIEVPPGTLAAEGN